MLNLKYFDSYDDILTVCSKYPDLKRMLQMYTAERNIADENDDIGAIEKADRMIAEIRAQMDEIEQIIAAHTSISHARREFRSNEERLFLRYHYVIGYSMEQTAEAMDISRDTVYRIRRRLVSGTEAGGRSAQSASPAAN